MEMRGTGVTLMEQFSELEDPCQPSNCTRHDFLEIKRKREAEYDDIRMKILGIHPLSLSSAMALAYGPVRCSHECLA